MSDIKALHICEQADIGAEGFLSLRRLRLQNIHADGTRSPEYPCDFVVRKLGLDAVVVALYHRTDNHTLVLLRDGLRPTMHFGRPASRTRIPDSRPYMFFREVVAGIIEDSDEGEAGVKQRAVAEIREEAGFEVRPSDIEFLGAGSFPAPGLLAEKMWLTAVHIADRDAQLPLQGDGSPMEHGARTMWLGLDDAIEQCVRGDIEDAKTELILRRLRDHIRGTAV